MRLSELFDLSGKTVVLTGGGSGLGLQMADALAEAGANLVLCARKAERCVEAARALEEEHGVQALGLGCDVRSPDDVEALVAGAVDAFGSIDVLVNSAGTTWGAAPEEMPLEGWRKVIDVNLTGTFLVSQAVGRVMIEQGGGAIVNVSSVTAFRGSRADTMDAIVYNASKGGVTSLTLDLAVKWAPHGIRVNAIAPGWFPTEMSEYSLEHSGHLLLERIPMGRFGGPDELKGAVVFLASRAGAYVTGQTLVVDGGLLALG